MDSKEIVAQFVDTIGSIWGRDLTKGAALAYIQVAGPYTPKETQSACDLVLQGAQFMPTPATLADALREQRRTKTPHREPLASGEKRPSMETIGKLMDDYLRRTGQKRRGK